MLRNCPFDALAREHTELVCGMNLAILDAATQQFPRFRSLPGLNPHRTVAVLSWSRLMIPAKHRQPEESVSPSSAPVRESFMSR